MHVISRKKLRDFWTVHRRAKTSLENWFRVTKIAEWNTLHDVQETFPNADAVGKLVVFNIAGNKYRLIAAIHFNRKKIYVRHVLTHAEYDLEDWKGG